MGAVAQLVQCCMLAIVLLLHALHTAYDGKDTSTKLVIERSVLPDSPLHNDAGEALL